jgi:outer membrane protein TolC
VRAAAAARRAAAADAWRAKALYLPRVNGFARYDWNDRNALFANERAWTVGVMATWTPFAGASEIGEVRGANARAAAADARAEAAAAQAALDLARSRDRVAVALAQLEIAERAVTQAAEAHRIVARKYDGGLATISDLLEAAALETQSRLGEAAARYRLILATAERHVAIGADLSAMVALDNAPTDR